MQQSETLLFINYSVIYTLFIPLFFQEFRVDFLPSYGSNCSGNSMKPLGVC